MKDPDAVLDPAMSNMPPTRKTAEKRSEEAFLYVLANGPKIELEHHLVYNARMSFHSYINNVSKALILRRL
jgi:hypothetical protein